MITPFLPPYFFQNPKFDKLIFRKPSLRMNKGGNYRAKSNSVVAFSFLLEFQGPTGPCVWKMPPLLSM